MSDLKIGTDGDLTQADNWDLSLVSGAAQVAQAIRMRLGTTWYESILGKHFNESKLKQIFTTEILKVSGVIRVDSLTFEFRDRTLAIDFTVTTSDGTISEQVIQ